MAGMAPDVPMYLLYPSTSATNLDEVSVADDAAAIVSASTGQGSLDPDDVLAGAAYVCVCIDSTWGQAREMAVPTLEKMPARTRLIQLPLTSTDDADDGGGSRVDAPGLRRFSEGDGGAGSLLTAPAPVRCSPRKPPPGPWRCSNHVREERGGAAEARVS